MPASGKSFLQAYNVQAGVESESLLIVTEHVTQNVNGQARSGTDLKGPGATGANRWAKLKRCWPTMATTARTTSKLVRKRKQPFIAAGREATTCRWNSVGRPPPMPAEADAVETMGHRLKTPEGRAIYGRRKCTVEPVFGIIKSVLGFRQFHLRRTSSGFGRIGTLVSMA